MDVGLQRNRDSCMTLLLSNETATVVLPKMNQILTYHKNQLCTTLIPREETINYDVKIKTS